MSVVQGHLLPTIYPSSKHFARCLMLMELARIDSHTGSLLEMKIPSLPPKWRKNGIICAFYLVNAEDSPDHTPPDDQAPA